ncbi:MAG: hypothetical protein KC645_05010 [Gemmatimonadetes bacterium]|nr:hypothetical protein [Gemmatimonadota bacterium]
MRTALPFLLLLAAATPVRGVADQDTAAPLPSAPASSAVVADALRERAVGLLDGSGPDEIALAQLTRAALLDPDAPETWSALRRGAERMSGRRALPGRLEDLLAEHLPAALPALHAVEAGGRAVAARWPAFLSGRVAGAVAGLVVLFGSLGLIVRRGRAARRPVHPVSGARGRVVLPGAASPEPVPTRVAAPVAAPAPTAVPTDRAASADEQALVAWLARRRAGSGGSADPGILARA